MSALPSWLDWLGSPSVYTVITAVAIVTTVVSWLLKEQNRKLKLQVQGGVQVQGGQQQGAQQQGQQQQVQEVHGDVYTTINYGPVVYNTETTSEMKGPDDDGNN
jgi:uncharacterized membrane protein